MKNKVERFEKKEKVSQLQLFEFYTECITFFKSFINTMSESHRRNNQLLMTYHVLINGVCDQASQQFETQLKEVKTFSDPEIRSFNPEQLLLDPFIYDILGSRSQNKFPNLWKVIKMILLLSRDQAGLREKMIHELS